MKARRFFFLALFSVFFGLLNNNVFAQQRAASNYNVRADIGGTNFYIKGELVETDGYHNAVITNSSFSSYASSSNAYSGEITIPAKNTTVTVGTKVFKIVGIAPYAFANSSITSISIPGEYEYGVGLCQGATSLTSVTFQDGLESVPDLAFEGCNSLNSVTFGQNVTEIGELAFANCSALTSITLPDELTTIRKEAFKNTGLTTINLSDNVSKIYYGAFSQCQSLGVINLGSQSGTEADACRPGLKLATYNHSQQDRHFGADLIEGSNNAYFSVLCPNLPNVIGPDDEDVVGGEPDGLGHNDFVMQNYLDNAKIHIVRQTELAVNSIIKYIPEGYSPIYVKVTAIDGADITAEVVKQGSTVTPLLGTEETVNYTGSVYVPKSFEFDCYTINISALPSQCFSMATSMTKAYVDVPVGEKAFDGVGAAVIIFGENVTSIGSYAFISATNLMSIEFKSSNPLSDVNMANLLNGTFTAFCNNTWFKDIIVPCDAKEDYQTAWDGKIGNNRVIICETDPRSYTVSDDGKLLYSIEDRDARTANVRPVNKETIDEAIIAASVSFGTEDEYTVTKFGLGGFQDCPSLTRVYIPNTITIIVDGASLRNNPELKEVEFQENSAMTSLAQRSFNGDAKLERVINFPSGVTSIPPYLFIGCTNLESVILSDNVTSIGTGAFYNCSSLTSIGSTDNVTSIGNNAFDGCSSLTSIGSNLQNVKTIAQCAFRKCNALTGELNLTSIQTIGGQAFYRTAGTSGFTAITLGDSLTSIGNAAFANQKLITSLTIPAGVNTLSQQAIFGCSSLTELTLKGNTMKTINTTNFTYTSYTLAENLPALQNVYVSCALVDSYKNYANVVAVKDMISGYPDALSVDNIAPLTLNDEKVFKAQVISNPVVEGENVTKGKLRILNPAGNNEATENHYGYETIDFTQSFAFNCETQNEWEIAEIGSYAFAEETALQTIKLPQSVTTIAANAFLRSSITGINFDTDSEENVLNGLTTIGESAFEGASLTGAITWTNNNTAIGASAFKGTGISSIILPKEVNDSTFKNCANLTIIDLTNVTSLGESAFASTGLTTVTIPESLNLNNGVFASCTNLSIVTLLGDTYKENASNAFTNSVNIDTTYVTCATKDQYTTEQEQLLNVFAMAETGYEYSGTGNDQIKVNIGTTDEPSYMYYRLTDNTNHKVTLTNSSYQYETSAAQPETATYSGDVNIPTTIRYNCEDYTVIGISDYAFAGADNLSVTFEAPENITTIGKGAFKNSGLETFEFPELINVNAFGESAFEGTRLSTVTIPGTITTIPANAFANNGNLKTVYLYGDTIKTLSNVNAFADHSSENFVIYALCSNIDGYKIAENWTNYADNFAVENDNVAEEEGKFIYTAENGVKLTFEAREENGTDMNLIACTLNEQTEVYVPGTFKYNCTTYNVIEVKMSENLFYDNATITKVVLGEGITTIESNAFVSVNGSSALSEVSLPSTLTAIPNSAFSNSRSLATVAIAEGSQMTEIGMRAFRGCTALTSISIPGTVTTIGSNAFVNTRLETVALPTSLVTLGDGAFQGISTLTSVTGWPENMTTIPNSLFKNDAQLQFSLPEQITEIGNNAFEGCASITSVDLSNVTSLGTYVFYNCSGLESVTFNQTMTILPQNTFANCTNLTEIILPETLTTIGTYSLANTGISSIDIPENVTSLAQNIFRNCANLTTITFTRTTSAPTITSQTFLGINSVQKIIYACSVKDLYRQSFSVASNFAAEVEPKLNPVAYELAEITTQVYTDCECELPDEVVIKDGGSLNFSSWNEANEKGIADKTIIVEKELDINTWYAIGNIDSRRNYASFQDNVGYNSGESHAINIYPLNASNLVSISNYYDAAKDIYESYYVYPRPKDHDGNTLSGDTYTTISQKITNRELASITVDQQTYYTDDASYYYLANPYYGILNLHKIYEKISDQMQGQYAYVWNKLLEDFDNVDITNHQIGILPANAFVIPTSSEITNLTFTIEESDLFSDEQAEAYAPALNNVIAFSAVANDIEKNIYARVDDNASNGFDKKDACVMLSRREEAVDPYFSVEGKKILDNHFNELPYVADLDFYSNQTNTVEFSLTSVPDGIEVSLADVVANTNTIMEVGEIVNINLSTGNNEGRYQIHFSRKNSNINDVANNANNIKIWNSDSEINISGDNLQRVEIYNTLGQKVYEGKLSGNNAKFNSGLKNGAYVIKAYADGNQNKSEKVVIR